MKSILLQLQADPILQSFRTYDRWWRELVIDDDINLSYRVGLAMRGVLE